MAIVLLAGRALALDADGANLLGLAAVVLQVHRPSAVGDVGFQLSFAATLGLIVFTRPLLARAPALPLGLHVALAGSLAAQAPLVPLLAAHFHRVAPAALLLNLVAVPLSAGVLLAGATAVGVSAFSDGAGAIAGALAWMLAHALLASGEVVRQFPALDHRMPDPSIAAAALYACGLIVLAVRPGRRAVLLTLAGLAGVMAGRGPVADGRVHVTILDVGQGDSIVVRSPRGRAWVVDAGPAFGSRDMGESVVAPYLWSHGLPPHRGRRGHASASRSRRRRAVPVARAARSARPGKESRRGAIPRTPRSTGHCANRASGVVPFAAGSARTGMGSTWK